MKEIGLRLKLKREENGVSLEEAASSIETPFSSLFNFNFKPISFIFSPNANFLANLKKQ